MKTNASYETVVKTTGGCGEWLEFRLVPDPSEGLLKLKRRYRRAIAKEVAAECIGFIGFEDCRTVRSLSHHLNAFPENVLANGVGGFSDSLTHQHTGESATPIG